MDVILNLLFDLIVEGSIAAAGDKKVPMPLRILAALVLVVVFGGSIALCIILGIMNKNWIIIAVGAIIAVIVVWAIISTAKKHKR